MKKSPHSVVEFVRCYALLLLLFCSVVYIISIQPVLPTASCSVPSSNKIFRGIHSVLLTFLLLLFLAADAVECGLPLSKKAPGNMYNGVQMSLGLPRGYHMIYVCGSSQLTSPDVCITETHPTNELQPRG